MTKDNYFISKVRKSGNAHVITIPKNFREFYNIHKKDRLLVIPIPLPKWLSKDIVKGTLAFGQIKIFKDLETHKASVNPKSLKEVLSILFNPEKQETED